MFTSVLAVQAFDQVLLAQYLRARLALQALLADLRGEEGDSSSRLRLAQTVAAVVVISGLLWAASKELGINVADQIRGVGSWSP